MVGVLGGVSIVAQGAAGAQAGAAYEEALDWFDAGNYREAFIGLKTILKEHPRNLQARILLARTQLALGNGLLAEKELRRALAGGADPAKVRTPLARAYLAQGKFKELLQNVDPGIDGGDVNAEVLILRGQSYYALGRMEEAAEAFTRAARARGEDPFALLGLASVRISQRRTAAAEDLLDRVVEMDPQMPEAWYQKGEISQLRGDRELAVDLFSKALALRPDYLDARIGRAASQVDLGRIQAALEDIDFVLAAHPGQFQAAYLKSLVLGRVGDLRGAREMLAAAGDYLNRLNPEFMKLHPPALLIAGIVKYAERSYEQSQRYLTDYLELNPLHAGARKILGQTLLQLGRVPEALAVLQPLVDGGKADAVGLSLLGSAYLKSRQFERASDLLARAVAMAPEQPGLRVQLALSELARGITEKARQLLISVLDEDPGNEAAELLLAQVYLRQGDYPKALDRLRGLVARQPNSVRVQNLFGVGLLKIGDLKGAQEAFVRALAIDGSFLEARRNLARTELQQGDTGTATKHYRAILKANPEDVDAMLQLSRIAEQEGRLDEAIDILERLRTTEGSPEYAVSHLVDLYLAAGRGKRALLVLDELRRKYPTSVGIQFAEGRLLLKLGRSKEAAVALREVSQFVIGRQDRVGVGGAAPDLQQIAHFQVLAKDLDGAQVSLRHAVSLNPDLLSAQVALARLEARLGQYQSALQRASEIQAKSPQSAIGETLRGDLLMQSGRYHKAEQAYIRAQQIAPSLALALRLYQAQQRAEGDDSALESLQRWVDAHSEDPAAQKALAIAYTETGRLEAARALNERLIGDLPDDPVISNNLAWVYSQMGDPRALEFAEKAYQLAPGDAAAADTLGWILVQQGEPARGLSYLRKAHAGTAGDAQVRYHLAVALNELGRRREARKELQQALDSSSDFNGASEARTLLRQISGKQ